MMDLYRDTSLPTTTRRMNSAISCGTRITLSLKSNVRT